LGQYPLDALTKAHPELSQYVLSKDDGGKTVRFSEPGAVKALNSALLAHFYQVDFWDIPPGYLCPPIPGRADYVHHLADLLAHSNVAAPQQVIGESVDSKHAQHSSKAQGKLRNGKLPEGKQVRGLDIGTGANVIYPILANRIYGWRMVGSDIDQGAVKSANAIVKANTNLNGVSVRYQGNKTSIFTGVVGEDDIFDFCMCNPPFHRSGEEAQAGSARKAKNLSRHAKKRSGQPLGKQMAKQSNKQTNQLNFAGQSHELWCEGGELGFIQRMLAESVDYAEQIGWFTCLVSNKDNLKPIEKSLRYYNVSEYKVINMAQGQKVSRFVAWRF
jgi:23S rRNA (adenine1618-N6)-methyltransferase